MRRQYIIYLKHARDYFESYELIHKSFNNNILDKIHVKHFLLFRSFELAFKSYLLYSGMDVHAIKRRVGHDIIIALEKCKKNKIEEKLSCSFQQELVHCLDEMNRYYKSKSFEYPSNGSNSYILHIQFTEPLNRLLNKLKNLYDETR